MAKDPAFLFYTDNFQSGTQFFTDEQVGKYIRLLCAQHLHGHLSEKQVLMICKTWDEEIMEKFVREDGKYYNKRLEIEVQKRQLFSQSRANNRLGKTKEHKKNTRKTSVKHLGNGNEDGNTIINKVEIPKVEDFMSYGKQLCAKARLDFREYAYSIEAKFKQWEGDGWKDGNGNQIKVWKTKLANTLPHLKPIQVPKDTWPVNQ